MISPTRLVLVVCAATLLRPVVASADAIDDLAPGSWYEVPDSTLRPLLPDPLPPNWGGPDSIMGAWSGAAYDTARERLIVWGGGHADYAGNELYTFGLQTLAWERIWGPTPNDQIFESDTQETYGDGNPASRHTYSGLAYAPPPVDAFVAMGGSLWMGGGGTQATWRFSFDDGTWSRGADYLSGAGYGDPAVYDPMTGHIFHRGNWVLDEYDPVADTFTERYRDDGGFWVSNVSAAIAPDRRVVLYIGDGSTALFHLDDYRYEVIAPTGGDIVQAAGAPGVDYDPLSGRFVAWIGGDTLYTLDLDAMEWRQHASTGGPSPGDAYGSGGTFGRFRYAPSRNVFVLANGIDSNVFVVRVSEGQGVPPDPLPPDAGVGANGDAGPGATDANGGCGCRAASPRDPGGTAAWLVLGAALIGLPTARARRRRRTRRPRSRGRS